LKKIILKKIILKKIILNKIEEENNEIKKQIDEIEKNNDNNLDEYIKNYRENQELLDSEALKEHLLEMNV